MNVDIHRQDVSIQLTAREIAELINQLSGLLVSAHDDQSERTATGLVINNPVVNGEIKAAPSFINFNLIK